MAPLKFINLLAISSLAVFACSFGASPVTALATDIHQVRDISVHAHGAIAKRKRAASSNAKRCRQRPTSSSSTSSTPKNSNPKTNVSPKAASTTHTTATHKAVATTTSGGGSGGKVGLAWANGVSLPLKPWVTNNVRYLYTWGPSLYPNSEQYGIKSMPMLWGRNQISEFTQLVKRGYSDCVMGPNEPNEPGQSNMSPGEAADLWKKYIEPLTSEGYTMLLAPVTSSNPNGMEWMKNWYKSCNGGCKPTHQPLHYYDVSASGFITYMKLWHDTFKLPLMVTEFACQSFTGRRQCSQSEVDSFLTESINFMENTPWIHAYFAFGIMENMQGVNTMNQLMDGSGKPNALGQKYIDGSL